MFPPRLEMILSNLTKMIKDDSGLSIVLPPPNSVMGGRLLNILSFPLAYYLTFLFIFLYVEQFFATFTS